MRTCLSFAALALAALPLAPLSAGAQPGGPAVNGAGCAYESLPQGERAALAGRAFAAMSRGGDERAFAAIDAVLDPAQAACAARFGWSPAHAGMAREYARLALMRDGLRQLLDDQGVASAVVDAYHRDHRAALGRELSARQQAAFTAELSARRWAAADASDSAIDVAVGYLAVLSQLDWCERRFAATLALRPATQPVQTAAR